MEKPLEQFAAYLGRRFAEEKASIAKALDGLKAELFRRVDNEISAAISDIREVHAGQTKIAEKLAARAAERAVIQLSAEVEELRREIEAMKTERANVRAIR
ncbi:hypothetical protein GOD82_15025 [Sinorhizobium medicae]|uniref:hypothetical protein n=1 Tax=Sinorhizobium medicae TaxID=110321 RepID=UPI000FDAFCF9|nr:hypothetical protein [Sinorhizobium medicae]MDX0831234.1 hypothetical protein [Sinorhizobium medicae]RVI57150.1 hypothetical protein CN192_11640 [Sinorhizobium medicae]UFX00308.1 hypothetical protein SmedWSM1115_10830 [Sinorhizobium medicae WSM1115]